MQIDVLIPGLLRSYTDGVAKVALTVAPAGAAQRAPTVDDALAALDMRDDTHQGVAIPRGG